MNPSELLRNPGTGDHIVQTYQDPARLADSVAEYLAAALRAGEAAIVIARPQHQRKFSAAARYSATESASRAGSW